ncbi:MAG: hypothetical protein R6W77_05235 [Trueperaceae bacterium]
MHTFPSFLHTVRRLLTLALSASLAFPLAPFALAQPGPAGASAAANADPIVRQKDVLRDVLAELDPTTFDVDALSLELAFAEPEDIVAYVAGEIAFESYAGLLRGPQGTLVARAGNALDQSVLLARLLTDAGYEARVALASLDDDDANRLLRTMFDGAGPGDATTAAARDEAASAENMEALARITGTDLATIEAGLADLAAARVEELPAYQAAGDARSLVTAALAGAGIELGGDATGSLAAEASSYAWVEYRLFEDEPWSAAHPAFGGQAAPAVQAERWIEGAVPDELLHKVRIEVMLERKRGDEFSTVALMEPWERPAANMLGIPIEVGNVPLGEGADASLVELGTDLAEVAFFVPTLNGSMAPEAQAFDTLGNVVPPDAAASAMAGVFQTVGEKGNAATSALGALGDGPSDDEPFALVAQWVDYVLVAPGGEETRHRRFVFDRRTPEARATGGSDLQSQQVLLNGILSQQTVMVVSGALIPAYVAQALGEQSLRSLDVLEALRAAPAGDTAELMVELLADAEVKDHLGLIASFDAVGAGEGGVAYRATPTVVVLRQALTPGPEPSGAFGVDIVTNARRFLRPEGNEMRHDAQRAVLAGAWETSVEREYVRRFGVANHGTYAAFGAGDVVAAVVAPFDVEALAGLAEAAEALPALRSDVERGYAVVVPTGPRPEGVGYAWWRVDPVTGETLGVAADGRGAESVEYSIPFGVSAAFAGALAVPGALACATGSGGMAMALCFCDLAVTTGVALALGAALAAKFAGAAVALFLIGDIGAGTVLAIPGLFTGPCTWAASEGEERWVCMPA